MGLALGATLLSLAAPASSPSVPVVGAQDTYNPELTITGFNTVLGFEAAYAGVDLTVTYARRHTSATECGTHTETYRINASGVPQLQGNAATLFQVVNSASRGRVTCTYILSWPDVTGFTKPDSATLGTSFDKVQSGAYMPPTYYASSTTAAVAQSQSLVEDVAERYGDTPNNVMRYPMTVRPTATSPAGCDADTKRLGETELTRDIVPAQRAAAILLSFNADTPLILRPHGATEDCEYDVSFGSVTDLLGRYLGDRYIVDTSYAHQQTQISPTQREVNYQYTRNPTPSSFTPLEIGIDLTNAVPVAVRDTTFQINYRHASSTPAACQALAEAHDDWRITAEGAVERTSIANIVSVPGSPSTECEYEVEWPDLAGLVKPTPNPVVAPVEGRNTVTGVYTLDLSSETAATRVHEVKIDFPFRDIDGDGQNDYKPQFRVPVSRRGGAGDRAAGDDCPAEVIVTASIASGVGQQEIRNARLPGMHERCKLRFNFPTEVESGVPGITFHLNRGGSRYGTGTEVPDAYDRFTDGTDLDALASYGEGSYVVPINTSITLTGTVPEKVRNQTYRVSFEPRLNSLADVCRGRPDEDWEDWRIDADGNIARVGPAKVRLLGRAARESDGQGGEREGAACVPYTVVWPDIPGLAAPSGRSLTFTDHDYEGKSLSGTYRGTTYYHHSYDPVGDSGDVVAVWLNRAQAMNPPAHPADIYETFEVTIAPTTSSPPGCDAYHDNAATSRTYQVRLNQEHGTPVYSPVFTRDGEDRLVLRPSGQERDCEYSVSFPHAEDGQSNVYIRTGSPSATIRPGGGKSNGLATTVYSANPNPSFTESQFLASIELETTADVTADTTFAVDVVPGALPENCTQRLQLPITVQAGTRSRTLTRNLIMRPSSDVEYCSYTVTWSEREVSGPPHTKVATFSEGTMLGRAERSVRNRYQFDGTLASQASTFDGELQVNTTATVTQDTNFAVAILPPASPVGCDGRRDLTVTVLATAQSATLMVPGIVHQPSGTGPGCIYTVDWATGDASGAWAQDDTFTAGAVLRDATRSAANRYTAASAPAPGDPPTQMLSEPFTGELEVLTVANVDADTTFSVDVEPATYAPVGCTSKQTVPVTVARLTNAKVVQVPRVLVAEVAGTPNRQCDYTVGWPGTEVGGNRYIKDTSYGDPGLLLNSGHLRATNRYKLNPDAPPATDTPFAPSVSVTVPPLEGATSGESLFASVTLSVTVARDASMTQADCSLASELAVPFTVNAMGVASQTALPASLIGALADGTPCGYTVTFPAVSSASGAELSWTLTPATTSAPLSATATSASSTYSVGAVTFVPDTTIMVPASGHDGKQLSASFTGSAGGCPNQTLSYSIGAGGAVTPLPANPTLVAYPAGATASTELCSYTVAFSPTETGGSTLALQANSSTTVTGLAQAITAEYQAAPAPGGGNGGGGGNDAPPQEPDPQEPDPQEPAPQQPTPATMFDGVVQLWTTDGVPAGTMFTITVSAQAGLADCSPDQTFTIASVATPAAASHTLNDLINVPEGGSTACIYDVAWPTNESSGTMSAFVEDDAYASRGATLSDASPTAANRYTAAPASPGGDGTGNTGTPTVNPPAPTGGTPSGGTSRRPSIGGGGGGGGSRGGSSGGGSSGGGSGGGSATGPWVVAATSRVPVTVSLAMPERDFPVGTAIEVMLNVPGTCGDDTTAFAGLPANIGLVYALTAQSGTTADVLAADALALAGFAQRGDDTRDCDVRITLITAPAGCRLDSTGTNNVGTDDAGRSYVQLTGGQSTTSYSATPRLVCE